MKKIRIYLYTTLCSLALCVMPPDLLATPEIENPETLKSPLTSHKALYNISMVSKGSSAQLQNISGKMLYEWRSVCDGSVTNHSFNMLYEYTDSPAIKIESDFSTYESFDGQNFSFTARRARNGKIYDEVRGNASREENRTGLASYTMPENISFPITQDMLFPVAHTRKLIEYAQNNKLFFNSVVFDGSDEEGPVEINSFIGKKTKSLEHVKLNKNIDSTLLNKNAWRARLAFFPTEIPNEDAEYEIDLIVQEDGIISQIFVEYPDFSIKQNLIALENLPEERCVSP